MNPFREVLFEVAQGLPVNRGARERVLRELAADLNGLYDEARAAGLDEAAARKRAIGFAELGVGAKAALVEVHGPPHRRWSSSLSGPVRTRIERIAMTLSLLVVLKFGFELLGAAVPYDALQPARTWLRPTGFALLLTLVPWLGSGWRYHMDRDHRADPYEEHARTSWLLTKIAAGIGLAGLAHTVLAAWLEVRAFDGTDGAALLHQQLLHLRSQLALVATYLGLTTFALVVHARIVGRARSMRAHEDALLDELAPDHRP